MLGPTEVTRDEHPVDLGTRKQRALVAALVLHGGRAVGVDTLVDLLWGDAPPASVGGTLHAYVWKNNPLGLFVDYNPRNSCA